MRWPALKAGRKSRLVRLRPVPASPARCSLGTPNCCCRRCLARKGLRISSQDHTKAQRGRGRKREAEFRSKRRCEEPRSCPNRCCRSCLARMRLQTPISNLPPAQQQRGRKEKLSSCPSCDVRNPQAKRRRGRKRKAGFRSKPSMSRTRKISKPLLSKMPSLHSTFHLGEGRQAVPNFRGDRIGPLHPGEGGEK